MKKEEIINFFDKESIDRDLHIDKNPIVSYEQKVRQDGVFNMLKINNYDKILDVGCGNLRDLKNLTKIDVRYYGLDISKKMLIEGLKNIKVSNINNLNLIQGDCEKLPFKDGFFDKIICSEVIEHIPDYEKAIVEMIRCLKTKGGIIITTPNKISLYGLYKKYLEMKGFKNIHPYDEWKTQREIIKILESNNIKIDKKIGICFIPSHITYNLPKYTKIKIIKVTSKFEKFLSKYFHPFGYMMGLSGIKMRT